MEDTTHQDITASVPSEIDEWNWGAFFLNGIWGIGNKTYVALLAFIPVVNIVMMFVLGFKGNAMAWKNKEWESIEHFKTVQRNWNIAGLIALALYIVIFIIEFWSVLQ